MTFPRPLSSAVAWLGPLLRLVYPEVCQLCQEQPATPSEGYVCQRCRLKVRFIDPPYCARCGIPFAGEVTIDTTCSNCRGLQLHFSRARSAVVARDPVLEVIHRYKYHRALWFEPFLADLLIQKAVPDLAGGSWQWILPVPLHSKRFREREFNQAEHLARRLSRATEIPVHSHILQRLQATPSQTTLSREQRAENVRSAFATTSGVRLNGERIVLIDDVLTTGATTSACSRVLLEAGAAEVCVWTVARGT